jgi:hypothetical protein
MFGRGTPREVGGVTWTSREEDVRGQRATMEPRTREVATFARRVGSVAATTGNRIDDHDDTRARHEKCGESIATVLL